MSKSKLRPMDDGAKFWMLKYAKQNLWRVPDWYEIDDLIQDGFLHYQRIAKKYRKVKTPAHIMALFKRTYTNHIHDLSGRRTKAPPTVKLALSGLTRHDDFAEVLQLIAEAPGDVKRVLTLLVLGAGTYANAGERLGRNRMQYVKTYLQHGKSPADLWLQGVMLASFREITCGDNNRN